MSWQALARKEFKEHIRPSGKWSGTLIAALVMAVLFGIGATTFAGFMQREFTEAFGRGAVLHAQVFFAMLAGVAASSFSVTMIPMNLGIDTIAGERERHTLETLLAGPLPDKQILWAKTVAIIAVGLCANLVAGLAIWVTLIVLYAQYGLAWGALGMVLAVLAPLLPTFAVSCFAYVFAIRSKTVKDAAQKMSYVMIPFFIMPAFVSVSIGAGPLVVILVASGVGLLFMTAMVVFPILAFTRFTRARLLV